MFIYLGILIKNGWSIYHRRNLSDSSYSHTYISLRHQADTHNRSPSPRPSTLHHSRCAQPPLPTFSFACCAPPACDLSDLMPALSLSPKLWSLKRSLRDLGIPRSPKGSIYPTGTRFHILDFSLISGSPGDKASTRSRGPATRVTCQGNQDSLRLVLARAAAVACRA